MLFTIRALHKHQRVVEKHVDAVDLEQAVAIGKRGCALSIGDFTYISTEPFMTWDASILEPSEAVGVPPVPVKKAHGRVGV